MALGGTFSGVVIDSRVLAQLNRDSPGLVRYMLEVGDLVKHEAQTRVGVGKEPPAGPARVRRPGTLRDSIVKRIVTHEGTTVVQVGSEDEIALIHHEGTEPHTITAVNGRRLAFWSDRAGRVIFATQVNHPGTRPNRFLTDSLAALGRTTP